MQIQLQNTWKSTEICIFSAFSLFEKHSMAREKGQNIWVYQTAEEMAANHFHNYCQCSYIIALGIGVTWHSRMSNASNGCQISRLLSSYAGPGRRCINAMWQYQSGCLHSCDTHHSVCLLSKEVTVRDPFKTHGPGRGLNPPKGGALSCEWFTSARKLRSDFEVIDHCLFPKTAPNTFLKESQLQLASWLSW